VSDVTSNAKHHFASAAGTRRRDRYFLFASATLLLIVFVGFSPTLYLKVFFATPDLPIYLHMHGGVITLWFLWLLSQTSLIAVNRVDLHRQLGKIAAVFGFAVVPAGLMAILGEVPRLREAGVDVEANLESISAFFWGNLCDLLAFSGYLLAALYFRRQPDFHKRLMLLASLVITLPALARISRWPVFSSIGEIPFALSAIAILLGTLFAHDLMTRRRLHVATVVGGSYFLLNLLGGLMLGETEFAQNFVRGL